MRTLLKIAAIALLMLCATSCFAAGGTCPTGANYTNPTTRSQTATLSSLGVTSCYFIAANGSDSNDGLSEASGHPWLHAPFMPNCSGTCATVQATMATTAAAGLGFILRGGDTWHEGNASATPYTGGQWLFNATPFPDGTSTNPVYWGVDQSWFTGGSWVRPILTGDNPICNLSTLSASCVRNTNAGMSEVVYVTSCPYQNGSGNNDMVVWANQLYNTFDNIELTGLCESDTNNSKDDKYVSYGSTTAMVFTNLYIHGWTHTAFTLGCPGGSVCFNISQLSGSCCAFMGTAGETVAYNVIDGVDSDPAGGGLFFPGLYNTYYNVFRYLGQGIYHQIHVLDDNLFEHWYEPGDSEAHGNVLESDGDAQATNAWYNNVFRHICTDTVIVALGGQPCPLSIVGILPSTQVGYTTYYFNNLMYDVTQTEYWGIGDAAETLGTQILFNNTFQTNAGSYIFACDNQTGAIYPFQTANNHFIIDSGTPYANVSSTPGCTNQQLGAPITEVNMTNATATTDGYTGAQTFAYSPTTSMSPTVGTGTNEWNLNHAWCTALTTAASGDALLSDAATQCPLDTRYGPVYNATTHTVSVPARTPVAHSTGATGAVGTYEYSASTPTAGTPSCSPGAGTYVGTQLVACSASPSTVQCYTTNGTTPATNGTSGCTTGTLVSGNISIAATSTLKVIAGGTGYLDGSVASYAYTINSGGSSIGSVGTGAQFRGGVIE